MTHRVDCLVAFVASLTISELHKAAARMAAPIKAREVEQPPEPPDNPNRRVIGERRTPTAILRLKLVGCGKARYYNCEGLAHGPYWYAYWWEKINSLVFQFIHSPLTSADTNASRSMRVPTATIVRAGKWVTPEWRAGAVRW